MRNEQRGDAQEDRSHLEPAVWKREAGGGEPPLRVHLDFRIPHIAPASGRFPTSVRCVLGNLRVSRYRFQGYPDSGNTRE